MQDVPGSRHHPHYRRLLYRLTIIGRQVLVSGLRRRLDAGRGRRSANLPRFPGRGRWPIRSRPG
jgi:hypothetical protein